MKNLKKFNQVRRIAQNIKNEGFIREYKAIITPILYKYQRHIASDDEMLWEIQDSIQKIYHLSVTYQYVPNHARKNIPYSYDDHEKLFELENLTKELLHGNTHKIYNY